MDENTETAYHGTEGFTPFGTAFRTFRPLEFFEEDNPPRPSLRTNRRRHPDRGERERMITPTGDKKDDNFDFDE